MGVALDQMLDAGLHIIVNTVWHWKFESKLIFGLINAFNFISALGTSGALRVHSLDLCLDRNGLEHHTEKFDAMHRNSSGLASNLVIRRGQPFRLIISFNRPFDSRRDSISFIFTLRDDANPNHGHGTLVGTALRLDYDLGGSMEWSCVIDGKHGNILEILIKPAVNTAIGEWNFDIDTQLAEGGAATFKSPNSFIILFNPWCTDDLVYLGGNFSEKHQK